MFKADCNGNLLDISEQGSSAGFLSCASSLHGDLDTDEVLEDSNFFRNRSSSDSITVMGNKNSSSSSGSKAHASKRLNPRPGTETKTHPPPAIVQQTKQEPPMLLVLNDSSSSTAVRDTATDETRFPSSHPLGIEKSNTVETIYRDISETEEVQQDLGSSSKSSYQDVAHHHLFTCDDQLVLAANNNHHHHSDDSGSINAPELPLDADSCSLQDVLLCLENDGLDLPLSEPIERNQETSECVLSKDDSPKPLAEPHPRSVNLFIISFSFVQTVHTSSNQVFIFFLTVKSSSSQH